MVAGFGPAHERLEPGEQLVRFRIVDIGAPCRGRDHVLHRIAAALQKGGDGESRGTRAGEDLGVEVHFFDLAHEGHGVGFVTRHGQNVSTGILDAIEHRPKIRQSLVVRLIEHHRVPAVFCLGEE